MSFEANDFRATMGHFATGVTVVTTVLDHTHFGLTVNAFCSVSLKPSLILVSLDLHSQTLPVIRQRGVFAVNVLAQEQGHLAMRFARKDLQSKTFDDIPLRVGQTGAPLFSEALAWIECRVVQEYPGGDHALVLSEVLHVASHGDHHEPLLYYRSSFRAIRQEDRSGSQPVSTTTVVSGRREGKKTGDAASILLV